MYSVVLLAALTAGQVAPDWCHRHHCGCYAGYGCYGCYGGYGSYGCYAVPGFYGCHGCYGCFGGWGCYGCFGCWGGLGSPYLPTTTFGPGPVPGLGGPALGLPGSAVPGAIPGAGYPNMNVPGANIPGMTIPGANMPGGNVPGVNPPAGEAVPRPAPGQPQPQAGTSVRAKLVVDLPEDAKLFVDNVPMKTTSSRRVFVTPPLQEGQTYYYELRAEMERNGQPIAVSGRVVIRPGQEVQARLTEPSTNGTFTVRASN